MSNKRYKTSNGGYAGRDSNKVNTIYLHEGISTSSIYVHYDTLKFGITKIVDIDSTKAADYDLDYSYLKLKEKSRDNYFGFTVVDVYTNGFNKMTIAKSDGSAGCCFECGHDCDECSD